MPSLPFSSTLLACAAASASFAAAAQVAAPAPATPEACLAIETDAARLACYDAALSRAPVDTAQADAAAAQAGQQRVREVLAASPDPDASLGDRARQRLGAVFANDPEYDALRANAGKGSLLDSRWELASDSKLGIFQMRAYKPVYLFPAFWSSNTNDLPSSPNPDNTVTTPLQIDSLETKFQISFKTKFLENMFGSNGDLWGGYTQNSRWQVYNTDASRPFRETNYEPEVMLVFRNNYSVGQWHGRMTGLSLNHQSNGRGDPWSRSWNRVIVSAGLDRDNWALVVRPWWRLDDGSADDNPDIEDYMGRGDAMLVHTRGGHEYSLLARHSLRGGDQSHGALQLGWGFPITRTLRGHLQVFHGYGESMIDYNHKATSVGLGISLLEWF